MSEILQKEVVAAVKKKLKSNTKGKQNVKGK